MKIILFLSIFFLNIYANIFDFKTLKSDFVQTITNEQNSTITYTGIFYATDRQIALWIYKTPISKKVYFIKSKVVIIEPELEQAIITNLQNSPNFATIIKSAKQVSKNRYMAKFEDTNYYIDVKNGEITSINYKDKLENRVVIKLKNMEKNIILDDVLFKLNIPKEYDIVTQ
ncbi:MAG: LolA-like outer membrane lipoprotein chaperone [Sulfurospirillum sp.]